MSDKPEPIDEPTANRIAGFVHAACKMHLPECMWPYDVRVISKRTVWTDNKRRACLAIIIEVDRRGANKNKGGYYQVFKQVRELAADLVDLPIILMRTNIRHTNMYQNIGRTLLRKHWEDK